ncbi:MAG: tetratricopeptide repeat protein [Bacteroidota bacterium]|jgi:outer membrane protein assembly factor BamD (BamD/ComL family)|nr:tetratricopeptide repeat protein [Bacteroidota bacterium]
MFHRFIILFALPLLIGGCAGQDASDLLAQATTLRESGKGSEALPLYEQITRDYAESPQAPEAMYHCAVLYFKEQMDPIKAATTYELVAEKFPQTEWGHRGLFAAAYTYANEIGNLERGRHAYEKYLAQYADSSMAETVRFELENLGKSAEELLESIQQSQAAESATAEEGGGQ